MRRVSPPRICHHHQDTTYSSRKQTVEMSVKKNKGLTCSRVASIFQISNVILPLFILPILIFCVFFSFSFFVTEGNNVCLFLQDDLYEPSLKKKVGCLSVSEKVIPRCPQDTFTTTMWKPGDINLGRGKPSLNNTMSYSNDTPKVP